MSEFNPRAGPWRGKPTLPRGHIGSTALRIDIHGWHLQAVPVLMSLGWTLGD